MDKAKLLAPVRGQYSQISVAIHQNTLGQIHTSSEWLNWEKMGKKQQKKSQILVELTFANELTLVGLEPEGVLPAGAFLAKAARICWQKVMIVCRQT